MKEIVKTFEGEEIRIIFIKEDIYFCASDIGKALGLSNVYRQISGFTKGVHTVHTPTSGGSQYIKYISEENLYRLIFKSKKEEAIRFQDWVFEKVLPSIRKTGAYSIPKALSKKSKEARNVLTQSWKECGVDKPKEYAMLTVEEYKQLQFEKGKRKKDFDKEEILLLHALESMEALNLFYNPVKGYVECKNSLKGTAKNVTQVKTGVYKLEEEHI